MSSDSVALAARTAAFASMVIQTDPSGLVDAVTAVGLRVSMAEVVAASKSSTTASLTVYADTLVMDVASIPGRGVVLAAREVDLSVMPGGATPILVTTPTSGVTAVEVMTAGVTGGTLAVATEHGAPYPIPAGTNPLRAVLITIDPQGALTASVTSSDADIADLTARIYALNSFRASYAAASWLMNSTAPTDRATARSMMAWVVAGTGAAVRGMTEQGSAYGDLHDQALPLLVELSVASGTTYVPALSSSYYGTELSLLLDALDSYESKIASLQSSTDLDATIAQIGAALGDVAKTEVGPLDSQLASLRQNIADLTTGINSLNLQFDLQSQALAVKWAKVQIALTEKAITDWFNACFDLAMSAVKIGFDAAKLVASGGSDVSSLVGIITETATAAKTAYEAIDKVSKDPSKKQEPLLDAARQLVETQEKLNQAFATSLNAGVADKVTPTLFEVDPSVAWDNYIAEATVALKGVAVPAAGDYLVALEVLANYGKAMASKIATATSQWAQVQVVEAQIDAANTATARWQALEKSATDATEKAAALQGLMTTRSDVLRRSVFVSWTHFANSYYYLYFAKPPVVLSADMDTAALRAAVATTATWVGDLLGDSTAAGSKIELPNDDVDIELDFDIVTKATENLPSESALFTPATDHAPATLTWSVPVGTSQLDGVLPNRGMVAIWITDAKFTLDGVTPNSKRNVLTSVSTSGGYTNGFGPDNAHRFVAKSMVGDYGYTVGDSGPAYLPWHIDTAVYMTPTPFTEWTMTFDPDGGDASTATTLRMQLTVSFRSAS